MRVGCVLKSVCRSCMPRARATRRSHRFHKSLGASASAAQSEQREHRQQNAKASIHPFHRHYT
eukprot:10473550-Alexandrium_andersonii.AAC.1